MRRCSDDEHPHLLASLDVDHIPARVDQLSTGPEGGFVFSDYGDDADIAVVLATGDEAFIGPFRSDRFNSIAGLVTVTFSDDTGVTVAALALDERGW